VFEGGRAPEPRRAPPVLRGPHRGVLPRTAGLVASLRHIFRRASRSCRRLLNRTGGTGAVLCVARIVTHLADCRCSPNSGTLPTPSCPPALLFPQASQPSTAAASSARSRPNDRGVCQRLLNRRTGGTGAVLCVARNRDAFC